ncbi:MAG: hypothetical protein SW833_05800 [Cyanobacteriota bacterium]|nr:hypothetical protein [Cyanobacteriota bacterium]
MLDGVCPVRAATPSRHCFDFSWVERVPMKLELEEALTAARDRDREPEPTAVLG